MRSALGWIAVGSLTLLACFWGFWGAIEVFHEGWHGQVPSTRFLSAIL